MADVKTSLMDLPLDQIHEPDEALRKVNRDEEAYMGLVDSVRMMGVMDPITVRRIVDSETNEEIYGLVNGLQRLSASKDVGLDTIPCHVIDVEDGNLIEAQIMSNVHKIETKPVEYSRALLKILQDNPLLTRAELANRLAKTSAWISERLGLLKLTEEIGKLVDEEKIGLSNAYALAKLDPEEQNDFIDRAMTMPPQQFTPTVNARVKEIRDAKRAGRDAGPAEFEAVPVLRGRKELVAEMETGEICSVLCKEFKPSDGKAGFALGVKWALKMDPRSMEVQKAQDEERRAERARAREKSTLERKQKRAKDAAEKAEKLQKEAEEAEKKEAEVTASA